MIARKPGQVQLTYEYDRGRHMLTVHVYSVYVGWVLVARMDDVPMQTPLFHARPGLAKSEVAAALQAIRGCGSRKKWAAHLPKTELFE